LLEVQVPLQQLASVEQVSPSEMHALAPHLPATQLKPQQSVEAVQLAPVGPHVEVLAAQLCVAASHSAEQQSAPVTQTSPKR
jgi:hypothetical protein